MMVVVGFLPYSIIAHQCSKRFVCTLCAQVSVAFWLFPFWVCSETVAAPQRPLAQGTKHILYPFLRTNHH